MHFRIVDYNSLKEGCGAKTQISGSGSGSRFGSNIQNVWIGSMIIWSIEKWKQKLLSYLCNCIIAPAEMTCREMIHSIWWIMDMCKKVWEALDLHTNKHGGRNDFFRGWSSGFFQVVTKSIIPGVSQQWWNFILPTWH